MHHFSLLSVACLLSCSIAPAAAELVPKQLAGPPEEFAQMRAPDPAQTAITSSSALLPVTLKPEAGAVRWQSKLAAENGHLNFLLIPEDKPLQATVTGTNTSNAQTTKTPFATIKQAMLALGTGKTPIAGTHYHLNAAQNDELTLTLQSAATTEQRGHLLLKGDPRIQLTTYPRHRRQTLGTPLALNALLTSKDAQGLSLLGADAGRIERAELRVIDPQGKSQTLPMADDGHHDDGAAGDGVYGGTFTPNMPGTWIAEVIVHGRNQAGRSFIRTSEHVLPVLDTSLQIAGSSVQGTTAGGTRLSLLLPVVASSKAPTHYHVFSEVWGTDAKGAAVPVAWIGGMVTPQQGQLPLGLDERWITRAHARAPFTLRHLRVEDPDHFIPLAEAETLPLTLPNLRRTTLARTAISGAIDETMRMGPRPAALAPAALRTQATGSRLILVHGYCSNAVWPEAQFSNASTFLDKFQNRSNDEFARLLGEFGKQWSSFSTIAHSQGGMAALHLYNYYWSGLDNASGGRVMQSVGTPYQGTRLAGVIAALGGKLGFGCGSNSDLTYDGAKAWLAGIPNSARAKVNYYTTSFTDSKKWYVNDYCNVASDLVLQDPDDGVVEKVNAQLPGGVNLGHTEGQCHLQHMRDPPQYLDANRNAVMNANAAR